MLIGLTCGGAHAQFPDLVIDSIRVTPTIPAVGQTAVAGPRNGVQVCPACTEHGIHVGKLTLHQLEFADRLAKLLTFVNIRYNDIHAGLHDAYRAP